jgi:two-component system chemotaxis response regulator CheY
VEKKKILIVDDENKMLELLKEILKDYNYEVIGEALDGKEAVEKYKELKPDLVTMDIMMPGVDGMQALKEIIHFDHDAKVIMVTALYQTENAIRALKEGALGYIIKPYREDNLISVIERALSF